MNSSPFFSIIIPTYNSEATLSRCLDNILCQNFNDFEVLLMDALSSDQTANIALNYKDQRIKVYSEKDAGIYDAMNKGIKLSRGKWLYFLGSDDYLYNNDILRLIHFHVENKDIDVIYGNIITPVFDGKYNGKFDSVKIYRENICHQAIFFNRKLFDRTGYFNLKYKILSDYDHNLKWFLDEKTKIAYIPDVIAYYDGQGLSQMKTDELFVNDHGYNYIVSGLRSVPKQFLFSCCRKEVFNKNIPIKRRMIVCLLTLFILFRFK
jgi:glycosyltransferase involved in cell wall biosynthesis